jgi:predicted unusual protein kinase regulating ubiquinone biosynthesis (AarF/ABC1/UbiB family)
MYFKLGNAISIKPTTHLFYGICFTVSYKHHHHHHHHHHLSNLDPHGGNFMLLPDGRIGLIDFGSTKKLTRSERLLACLLYAAIARRDEQMLFDLCEIGGYKSKHGNKEVLIKLILFGYDSWGNDLMEGKNIQTFLDDLRRKDPWEEVPDNLIMAQVRLFATSEMF